MNYALCESRSSADLCQILTPIILRSAFMFWLNQAPCESRHVAIDIPRGYDTVRYRTRIAARDSTTSRSSRHSSRIGFLVRLFAAVLMYVRCAHFWTTSLHLPTTMNTKCVWSLYRCIYTYTHLWMPKDNEEEDLMHNHSTITRKSDL